MKKGHFYFGLTPVQVINLNPVITAPSVTEDYLFVQGYGINKPTPVVNVHTQGI